MADRYWVGGTGSWSSSNTANWAASSGGVSGATVPTAADNVFFDVNSNVGTGAFTCTMANSPRVCNNFTASGLDGTMTLAGASIGLTVSGSLSFPATNFTRTYTGVTTFNATTTGKTVTTNGVAFGAAVTFDGVGGGWTLGFDLSMSGQALTVTNGTFDTSSVGNYAITAFSFSSSNANVRTINLNGSTVSLSSTATAWNTSTTNNLTFNAGTSTINLTGATSIFTGGGLTYYNVTSTRADLSTLSFSGSNTFNNLTFTGRTTVGIGIVTISANQTINGTLTVSAGTASAYRTMIASDTIGTSRTLTCAAESLTDVDFRDIIAAGAGSPFTGTRLGNCGGNSNITFDAAKTVYYRQTGTANWGATGSGSWSATSGGALDATQFPLAQDTAVFPAATYPASGSTTTINANYNIGTIDMSLRTSNTMTLATIGTSSTIYGSWVNGTGITMSGAGTLTFAGRTTQNITSAGIAFTPNITINNVTGTVQLQDAFSIGSTLVTTLTSGTLNLQSYTLSTGQFNSSNSNTRTIAFGTGQINCTGTGTVWSTSISTNLTTTGTQVVNVTSTGSTAITVISGTLSEANSISYNFTGGTYALTFLNTTGHTARSVDYTGFAGTLQATSTATIYGNLKFSTGMTLTATTNALTFGATSGTQQITTNAKTLDFPLTFNGVGGTFQLQDALTNNALRTITLTNGTLDLQSFTLTTGLFSSSNSNNRTIAFGTGQISCTGTGNVWTISTATNLTCTGSRTVNVTSVGSTAISVVTSASTVVSLQNFNFTGGTYSLTISSNSAFDDLNFTGYAGTLTLQSGIAVNMYGDLTVSTGMSLAASTATMTFLSLGTQLVTTNGKTFDFNVTQSYQAFGSTLQLQDAWTIGSARTFTHIAGNLDLNGYTLSAGIYSSSINSNFRSIAFGTGNITLTSNVASSTVWNTYIGGTNFSYTGTPTVNISSTLLSGSQLFFAPFETFSTNTTLNFNFTSGSYFLALVYPLAVGTNGYVGALDFTGYSGNMSLYGYLAVSRDLKFSSGMTVSTFNSSYYYYINPLSGTTSNITTNGKTIPNFVYFGGVDGTSICKLLDAFTSSQNTRFFANNLDLNGQTLTTIRIDVVNSPFNLTFNGGTVVVTGILFNNGITTNLTTTAGTGTGAISMTSSGGKTFVGGGATYNCTLNQGGAGALTVSGSNTFSNITNTVQPATVLFTSGTTNTFTNFNLSGTAGNLITIGSTSAATHTLSKATGTVSVSYCSISYSAATGGATWESLLANGNVNAGNNTGWFFGGVIYDVFISEFGAALDNVTAIRRFNTLITEAATVVDQFAVAASVFNPSVAEAARTSDATASSFVASANIAETANVSDTVSARAIFLASLTEPVTATDTVAAAQTFATAVSELAVASEVISAVQLFSTLIAESATGSDSTAASRVLTPSVSEQAAANDAIQALFVVNGFIQESSTATDSVDAPGSIYNVATTETANALDAPNAGATFNVAVLESLTAADLLFARYLWELIDDGQTPDWVLINDANGVTWTLVNDAAPTTWQNINTLN